jgi:transcription termination factor Rho
MSKKYIIETGKFGQYFHNTEECRDIPLEEVALILNSKNDAIPFLELKDTGGKNLIKILDRAIAEAKAMIDIEYKKGGLNQNLEFILSCKEHIARIRRIKSEGRAYGQEFYPCLEEARKAHFKKSKGK